MDVTKDSWKYEVHEKLAEVFAGKSEDLRRILLFLDEEDKACKDNVDRPYAPQWESLKATLKMDKSFREFATRLADETKMAEKDPEFRKHISIVYEAMMPHCDDTVAIEEYQKLDPDRLFNLDATSESSVGGLARAWSIIPAQSKVSAMNCIRTIANKSVMTAVDDVVSLADKGGGTVVMVGLAAVYLAYSAYVNIGSWWRGEISGIRCTKILLDSTFTVGAGIAGGFAGVALGTLVAGPIGTVVGGIAGGWIISAGVAYLSDLLTQKMFGIPKEEALENAHRHLGVEMSASNAQVNTAFRKLCLKHHPDKGGSQDDFFILQCYMGIIKQARGEV